MGSGDFAQTTLMIRDCIASDVPAIQAIINDAAERYRTVIPADCWHEPYMSRDQLLAEINAGVRFSGWQDKSGALVGVMGLQRKLDAFLIRHAYVLTSHQGRGVGRALLTSLIEQSSGRLLVGTWAAAEWAISFYQRHGFGLVPPGQEDHVATTYWNITQRQRDTSVFLEYIGRSH